MSDATPCVSVVIPTYNRATTLLTAIESVLAGGSQPLEIIVVDDASADGTVELIRDVGDARIKLIALDENVGGAEARNRGIRAARGDWIAFQDSDDVWSPDHLEVLLDPLASAAASTGVVFGRVMDESGRLLPQRSADELNGDLRGVLSCHNVVPLPASIVAKSAIEDVRGFHSALPRLQDWDLFLSVARSRTFVYVDHPVLTVGTGDGRISSVQHNYYEALRQLLERHDDIFRESSACRVGHLMQVARHDLRNGQFRGVLPLVARAVQQPSGLVRWVGERVLHGRSTVARTSEI